MINHTILNILVNEGPGEAGVRKQVLDAVASGSAPLGPEGGIRTVVEADHVARVTVSSLGEMPTDAADKFKQWARHVLLPMFKDHPDCIRIEVYSLHRDVQRGDMVGWVCHAGGKIHALTFALAETR